MQFRRNFTVIEHDRCLGETQQVIHIFVIDMECATEGELRLLRHPQLHVAGTQQVPGLAIMGVILHIHLQSANHIRQLCLALLQGGIVPSHHQVHQFRHSGLRGNPAFHFRRVALFPVEPQRHQRNQHQQRPHDELATRRTHRLVILIGRHIFQQRQFQFRLELGEFLLGDPPLLQIGFQFLQTVTVHQRIQYITRHILARLILQQWHQHQHGARHGHDCQDCPQ